MPNPNTKTLGRSQVNDRPIKIPTFFRFTLGARAALIVVPLLFIAIIGIGIGLILLFMKVSDINSEVFQTVSALILQNNDTVQEQTLTVLQRLSMLKPMLRFSGTLNYGLPGDLQLYIKNTVCY